MWSCHDANAVLLLILLSLESHPTLEALTLGRLRSSAAARDALLRVIAANMAPLRKLHATGLRDDEIDLSALAGALQQNCHLQDLRLIYSGDSLPIVSAYEEHLLPAVLACTALRMLKITLHHGYGERPIAAAATVMQLGADREAARLAAELAKQPGCSA